MSRPAAQWLPTWLVVAINLAAVLQPFAYQLLLPQGCPWPVWALWAVYLLVLVLGWLHYRGLDKPPRRGQAGPWRPYPLYPPEER